MRILRRQVDLTTAVKCLWRSPDACHGYSAAVSLHSHTMHSREYMDFVPRVMRRVPPAHAALEALQGRHRRLKGTDIPFHRVFWRPPLYPYAAHELEAGQIRQTLGLAPIVSITDHDDLEACAELRAIGIQAPYSLEWTVPYRSTVFHIGVHNLPADRARDIAREMADCTANPAEPRIAGLLAEVDAIPDVLLVLNHPLCSEFRVERSSHLTRLAEFLEAYGPLLHALELNGLQPASDNREVIRMAAEIGMPVISGGDRHCLEPNANVNLTNARTFAEFVHEVRVDRVSQVLFLPQYREAIATRYIEFISHAVRTYPDMPGRERWLDRVFHEREEGGVVPLSAAWPRGGPAPVRGFIAAIGFLANPRLRATLRMALGEQSEIGA